MRRHFRRQARRAFTLIELMIVIAIIGVLAAIAVPNFKAARVRANIRSCQANMKTIAGAVEMYNLDTSDSASELDEVLWNKLVEGGYLSHRVDDPGEGRGSHGHYELTGCGDGIRCEVHGTIHGACS